jgi:5-methylcytosine-specific restriction endonuclease McrBC regulatory subunit McrC
MNLLYDLYISLTEEECGKEYRTEHLVGTFKTKEEAITAMKEAIIKGLPFFKPECESRIQEVEVIGETIDDNSVCRFFGYTQEGDLIESPYYTEKDTAIQDFLRKKKNTPGRGWCLNTYKLGSCCLPC